LNTSNRKPQNWKSKKKKKKKKFFAISGHMFWQKQFSNALYSKYIYSKTL